MYFILALLPILFLALAAARLFRRALGQTLPVALFFVAFLVFLCGLFGSLAASRYVVLAFDVASLVYLFVALSKEPSVRKQPSSLLTVDLSLVLGGVLLIVLLSAGRKVTDMDSFEQWAYIVKKMYFTDSLLAARGQYATTLSYPPGMGLLQYYFARFSPGFNEADLFRARDLLALSLFLPFVRGLNWKRWKTLLLLVPIVLLLPLLEYAGFSGELMTDAMLGLLFAWLLLAGMETDSADGFLLVGLALGSFFLSFTKVSGILFCVFAAGILFVQRMYRARTRAVGQNARRARRALPALVVLAAGILGWLAWRLYIAADSTSSSFAAILSLKGGLAQYQKETIVNFLNALFAEEGSVGLNALSPMAWVVAVPLFTAVAVRILSSDPKAAKRSLLDALLLTAGYFVWLAALLIGYLTSFVEGEALSLAAFPRYLSSYQLGALIVCAYSVVQAIESREPRARRSMLALLLVALLLTVPLRSVFDATVGAPYANSKTVDWRQRYAPASRFYEQLDPAASKICYLDENPKEPGYSFALFQFEALPYDVEKAIAWRLGGPYYDADYYSLSPSAKEWGQALLDGGFTHLYLRTTSDFFASTYGALFDSPADIRSDAYYTVSEENGQVLLTLVNPA